MGLQWVIRTLLHKWNAVSLQSTFLAGYEPCLPPSTTWGRPSLPSGGCSTHYQELSVVTQPLPQHLEGWGSTEGLLATQWTPKQPTLLQETLTKQHGPSLQQGTCQGLHPDFQPLQLWENTFPFYINYPGSGTPWQQVYRNKCKKVKYDSPYL